MGLHAGHRSRNGLLRAWRDALLEEFPAVICGLTHIKANGPAKAGWKMLYREAAARVAELAKRHSNIRGTIIDDFLHPDGPQPRHAHHPQGIGKKPR